MGCGSSVASVKVVPEEENHVTPMDKEPEKVVDTEKEKKAIDSRIEYYKDDKITAAECCYDSTEYFLNKVAEVPTVNSIIFYSILYKFIINRKF